jgi:flagellar motor switch protein FliG
VLVLALKAADDDLKAKIFGNMSKRAGELLRDDLEAKGPVRGQRRGECAARDSRGGTAHGRRR